MSKKQFSIYIWKINNKSLFYQRTRERLWQQARNCYQQEGSNKKAKNVLEIVKKGCKTSAKWIQRII